MMNIQIFGTNKCFDTKKAMLDEKVLKTPIVRNGNQATVGFCPEIWKGWS